MMAAMATAVSAVSTVRLASEVGLLGRLGLVDDERAGELVAGADAGTADASPTGFDKLGAGVVARADEWLIAGRAAAATAAAPGGVSPIKRKQSRPNAVTRGLTAWRRHFQHPELKRPQQDRGLLGD